MYHARNYYRSPFLFGAPFIGGVLGGLLGSALIGPRPFYPPPYYGYYPTPYSYPYYW